MFTVHAEIGGKMLYNCHPTSVVNKVVSLFKKRKRYQSFLFHALNVVLFVRIFKLLLLGFFGNILQVTRIQQGTVSQDVLPLFLMKDFWKIVSILLWVFNFFIRTFLRIWKTITFLITPAPVWFIDDTNNGAHLERPGVFHLFRN